MARRGTSPNLLAGALFAGLGVGVMLMASEYRIGTLRAIGPGFLPAVLGVLLVAAGLGIACQRRLTGEREPIAHPVRAAAFPVALACFGLLIDRFHLLLAVAGLVLVARIATPSLGWWQTGLTLVLLAGAAAALFVYGLDLPASFLLPG